MLVDAEISRRESGRMARLLKLSRLKVSATPEDVDFRAERGLNKRKFSNRLNCDWIGKQHLVVTGPTAVGKTWLTCALGHQAIRKGMPVLYRRFSKLHEEFEVCRADGSLPKLRGAVGKGADAEGRIHAQAVQTLG
ncbi:ATP-binding protein [Roseateles puraquae]|uniref:IstB-like ATP-binding domain-containing protein n=1 Tax=Roseateles puraquae TaxID=431059 RepID=A0A254NA90_9BURK|nr:hypothetical protein [Roseateles puraquae]OWR04916.1 hypothetical protein CDO81_09795 [Roseateles puraquae]